MHNQGENIHKIDWIIFSISFKLYGLAQSQLPHNVLALTRRQFHSVLLHLSNSSDKIFFVRNAKQWLITEIGERLIESAEHMSDAAASIERRVLADSQELTGLLRITVADVCAQ